MPVHVTDPLTADTVTASLAGNALVISPRFGESYSFDGAGRLLALFRDGRSYQRALDHRLLERLSGRNGPRRRELPPDEAQDLLERAFASLEALRTALPRLALSDGDRRQFAAALDKVLAFGPERLAADGAAFRQIYKPVSILPPDQYLALVLQATQGCSWNRCTFCGLYRDRTFRALSAAEFRAHCAAVRDFFGEGISLRRGIFLADANALVLSMERLRAIFAIAQEFFRLPEGVRPVFSFVSAFDVGRKTAAEWAELQALGLQRAYLGLETGDDALLRFLNKPGTVADAVEAVHALRAGGVSVGVILMAGIGGDRFAEAHVTGSVAAIEAMALGPCDQVYVSTYVSAPGTEYDVLAAAAGIRPLSAAEIEAQRQELQARLRAVAPQTIVAPYHIDGFAL